MARAYTPTDWDTHGPRVLELKTAGKSFKEIEKIIGVHHETVRAWFNKQAKVSPAQEPPMKIQFDPLPTDPVAVLPGQMSIEDTDTPAEVHYDAVNEFDTLPDGYAKVIQPMREYTEAEDAALKESVRLFGFIGAIVRDQYGRILDGNQRSRVAHWFGKGCPFTITHVKDDEHAMEIANQLNLARRHFTPEQRQQIAASLRDRGESYRYIAEALHVSHTQARADVLEAQAKRESDLTSGLVTTEGLETNFPNAIGTIETPTESTVIDQQLETNFPITQAPETPKRIKRKGGGTYPDQRPTGTKPKTTKPSDVEDIGSKIKDLYMGWLRRCEDDKALGIAQAFLNTLSDLAEGRAMQMVNPGGKDHGER